jgi:hypothetical protein
VTVYILLYAIILVESKNEKLLRNLLPKYKKFLKQKGRLTLFGTLFISMASQLISPRFKLSQELVYNRFYNRLLRAREDDDSGIKLEYDYLLNWIKKKGMELK